MQINMDRFVDIGEIVPADNQYKRQRNRRDDEEWITQRLVASGCM